MKTSALHDEGCGAREAVLSTWKQQGHGCTGLANTATQGARKDGWRESTRPEIVERRRQEARRKDGQDLKDPEERRDRGGPGSRQTGPEEAGRQFPTLAVGGRAIPPPCFVPHHLSAQTELSSLP